MRGLSKNKGSLLVYFLISVTIVGMLYVANAQNQRMKILYAVRMQILQSLINECGQNISVLRIVRTTAIYEGLSESNQYLRTAALDKFIKEAFVKYKFKENNKHYLDKLIQEFKYYGILGSGPEGIDIDNEDAKIITELYEKLRAFVILANSHNANFMFHFEESMKK